MDAVADIKSRLSIDQLVGQYVQLQKKGRNFIGLCPFHHDSRPSFVVSPDKGICYCFPCQKGGDIFSFYQLVENVDFRQALKDLAEKTGVQLPEHEKEVVKKDEKERMRECLHAAATLYATHLKASESASSYLTSRGVSPEERVSFELGLSPDSFTATYEHLLKAGFSRKEIQACGLGVQKDLRDEKIYDRFRNRLMFPIHDHQGRIIGFGGRAMGKDDDAKYLNSAESPLYHKSHVLYGLHRALKDMRERKRVVVVEGYFDVLACHRVGVTETVATCGTALTEEHARMLKRYVDRVVLCLDQDRAGRAAAERAFIVCSKEGLQVEGVVLGSKDPADAFLESPEALKAALNEQVQPFLDIVCAQIATTDLGNPSIRREAMERLLPLLQSISSSTERAHAIRSAATALGATETSLTDDLRSFEQHPAMTVTPKKAAAATHTASLFSSAELTLGLLLLYPRNTGLIEEMIEPEDAFSRSLYRSIKKALYSSESTAIDALQDLTDEERHRAGILLLYCEESEFASWNESVAVREIRHNCKASNRELLQRRQKEITHKLVEARKAGSSADEVQLTAQYQELLKLGKSLV